MTNLCWGIISHNRGLLTHIYIFLYWQTIRLLHLHFNIFLQSSSTRRRVLLILINSLSHILYFIHLINKIFKVYILRFDTSNAFFISPQPLIFYKQNQIIFLFFSSISSSCFPKNTLFFFNFTANLNVVYSTWVQIFI